MQDALGRTVALPAPPRRIVSLVPSLSELLHDLGLEAETVGVTRFCVHPPGWLASKVVVGGTKDVRLERLRALEPDLVIANQEENRREDVEALAASAAVYVTRVATVDDAVATIRALGLLVDRAARADALADEVAARFQALPQLTPRRVAYLIWRAPWMTIGGDTMIHDVLRRGGLVNAFAARPRYPEVSGDELRAAAPEVVLLSSEPFPFRERNLEEVRALVPGARVELVDGELFSWYGSRLRRTPDYLRALQLRLGGE